MHKFTNPVGWVKYKMGVIDRARVLYEACADPYASPAVKALHLNTHFEGWFNCTTLHVWMLQKKLLSIYGGAKTPDGSMETFASDEAKIALELSQELTRHVWLDVEIKLHQSGVRAKIGYIVSDLVSTFQGQTLAYDEGLYYGDAVLAAALWRNLFICKEDLDAQNLELALEYVRRNLQHLERLPAQDIIQSDFSFIP